jgi:hypothetical protein
MSLKKAREITIKLMSHTMFLIYDHYLDAMVFESLKSS